MGSAFGVLKGAARRVGVSVEEYVQRVSVGEKWCRKCRTWRHRSAFGADRSRGDGLASACSDCRVIAKERPGARERRLKATVGLAWCRGCRDWLPRSQVSIATADVIDAAKRWHAAREARRDGSENADRALMAAIDHLHTTETGGTR